MTYKIYDFTGITTSEGLTIPIPLDKVIIDYPDMFNDQLSTVNEIYEGNNFCLSASTVSMETMYELIECGYTIVPFTRTMYIYDLLGYYKLGMKVLFMKIKDYKNFKKDYEDGLVKIEDRTVKELF